jgi:solute carrier family 5 (sodium-coupled monocarboxylate transporter), member 8/12
VIGGFFYWGSLLCVNQATVQKAMSLRNLSKAKIAITLSIFGLVLVFLMNFYTGLMAFTKYSSCDPLKAGKIDEIDQMMPYYVMDTFGHITTFVGIFVAGVFAASLGTVAACLSSLSAVTIEDLLISGMNLKISSEKSTVYAKWMNFGYGVVSFGLIFLVEGRGILQATLTLNGLVGGILLGLFSLGIFFKKANLKGALYGGLLSTICVVTLGIFALLYGDDGSFLNSTTEGCSCKVNEALKVSQESDDDSPWYASIYNISYMWYSMIGTLLTVTFGLLLSIITHWYEKRQIIKILSEQSNEGGDNSGLKSSHPSSRRVSERLQTISHDVMQSATKIEKKILGVLSPSQYNNSNGDDKMNMINEESIQSESSTHNGPSITKMFEQSKGNENPAFVADKIDAK